MTKPGAILLAAALCAPLPTSAAGDDWLVFTIGSRHHKRGYNEHNWGVGIEHGVTDNWRAVAGTYRNSFYRQTLYAGAIYLPLRVGDWRVGAAASLVSGYVQHPVLVAFPFISYEQKDWGLNFGPILPTVVGIQFKLRY